MYFMRFIEEVPIPSPRQIIIGIVLFGYQFQIPFHSTPQHIFVAIHNFETICQLTHHNFKTLKKLTQHINSILLN